jgi:hypothetical protein
MTSEETMKKSRTGIVCALLSLCFGCAVPEVPQPDPAAAAATAFLQGCSERKWEEAERLYLGAIPEAVKDRFGGLQLLDIGTSFERPRQYDGRFVPYTVRLTTGAVIKKRLAMKAGPAGWWVDGGL